MTRSLSNIAMVLNGYVVGGWSEDSDALMLPDAFEVATVRRGATGDMAVFSTGDRGGPVTIKLLPNSPSANFFGEQLNRIKGGAVVVWEGSIHDSQTNARVTLSGGQLVSGRLGPTVGKGDAANSEFTFEFTDIDTDYTAARPIAVAAS